MPLSTYYVLSWTTEDGTPTRLIGETIFADKEDAQMSADDWSDYMASKGHPNRAAVLTIDMEA